MKFTKQRKANEGGGGGGGGGDDHVLLSRWVRSGVSESNNEIYKR